VGKYETRAVACEYLVHREAIDDHDATIAADHLAPFVGGFPRQDPIEGDRRRVNAPHRARRRARRVEPRPAGFIDVDHGRGERAAPQRRVRRLEVTRERLKLIPERLRIDAQALAGHHPHLTFERQMVGILRDRHAHGKLRCVATARNQLYRTGRRHHCAVAGAAVLLTDVPFDLIRHLHAGDPLGGLGLAGHLAQLAAARGTRALLGGEFVSTLDRRQRGLLAWPVPWLRATARRRRPDRWALEDLRARGPEIALHREGELLDVPLAAQPRELGTEPHVRGDEALVLAIEQATNLAQRVEIAFVAQLHHSTRI
jgi:hypothetical protein